MSDKSDTSSTVSIGSDNTEKSDEITADTVIERTTEPYHFNKAAHNHNRMTEIAVGGFHDKDMSEEYFMSVNQHKKSLR